MNLRIKTNELEFCRARAAGERLFKRKIFVDENELIGKKSRPSRSISNAIIHRIEDKNYGGRENLLTCRLNWFKNLENSNSKKLFSKKGEVYVGST